MADERPNQNPRWLLDLDEWTRVEYDSIEKPVDYGIVSYTWGRFVDPTRIVPEKEKPRGVTWNIPYVPSIPLRHARTVMETLKKRYVWWDWMCVPQATGNAQLEGEDARNASQEIANQM